MLERSMELARDGGMDVTRALPREAMWFFVAAPPVLAFLFDPRCVMEPAHVARALVAITGYTVITGVAVHWSYELVAARLRSVPWPARLGAHGLACAVVVAVTTLALHPPIVLVYPEAAGKLVDILWRGTIVSFVYLAIAAFVARLQRDAIRERLRAHEERTAALRARLAVLQAQMQPHFLFNSLNVAAGMIQESPAAAEETLDRLAGFLRHALESTERKLVPLDEEIDAIESYLHVQRARFGDRLRYAVDVDAAARRRRVPPMLLQPLVENAILHGLRGREDGGWVRVGVRLENDALSITIEDDGVGPGGSTHRGSGTGLANVRERIALVYGERAVLRTGRGKLGGFACELILPRTSEV
jgi:hypothetical protein